MEAVWGWRGRGQGGKDKSCDDFRGTRQAKHYGGGGVEENFLFPTRRGEGSGVAEAPSADLVLGGGGEVRKVGGRRGKRQGRGREEGERSGGTGCFSLL